MLTDKEKERAGEIAGLVAAALRSPQAAPVPLREKLSAWEIVRKWAYLAAVSIIAATLTVVNVRTNTRRINEIYPLVRAMDWMKQNGYTNKDVEPHGPIKLPKFD